MIVEQRLTHRQAKEGSPMKKVLLIAVALGAMTTGAYADGDAAAGEKIFKKCMACHSIDKGAANKVGPNLNGVIGRAAADGYTYSDALKAWHDAGNKWDEATIAKWINKPTSVVPGNKMAFPGLSDPADIANVIAYIKSKS